MDLTSFFTQLLSSNGCLVERDSEGRMQVLFPPSLQDRLRLNEMEVFDLPSENGKALTFVHRGGDLLESLGYLLSEKGMYCAVSCPGLSYPVKDPEKLLSSHLTIQNGVFRFQKARETKGSCLVLHFLLTATADTRMERVLAVAVNESSGTVPVGIEAQIPYLLDHCIAQGQSNEQGNSGEPSADISRSIKTACSLASAAADNICGEFIENLNKRLDRDLRRLQSYYLTLAREIEKRLQKKKNDPEEEARAVSRLGATKADYLKKMQDARDKYALEIVLEPFSALRIELPLTVLDVVLQRRKATRVVSLPVNPAIRGIESPVCTNCGRPVLNFYLCDALHILCADCFPSCPSCR